MKATTFACQDTKPEQISFFSTLKTSLLALSTYNASALFSIEWYLEHVTIHQPYNLYLHFSQTICTCCCLNKATKLIQQDALIMPFQTVSRYIKLALSHIHLFSLHSNSESLVHEIFQANVSINVKKIWNLITEQHYRVYPARFDGATNRDDY